MNYDFDRVIDRRGSGCFKYDALKMLYGRDDLISLWVADMDFAVSPAITSALQKRLDHGVFGYNFHLPEFYAVVASWVERRYGFHAEREWMLNSPGIMPAVNLAVRQLTRPGDGILIQTPVYRPFFNAIQDHGRQLLTNPLLLRDGSYQIDFDDFEQKLKQAKLFILCNPHNPIGRLWREDELRRMGGLCRNYSVPIISDEIHADIVYDGGKAISVAALEDFADNSICCVSPAKSFNLAGLASAVVIVKNPALREPLAWMIEKLHLYLGNSFGIQAVIAAYRDSDDWLAELLAYLQRNREFLLDFFATQLPQLKMIKPDSTYLAWIDFRALGLDDEAIKDMLVNKARLALDPGLKFGVEGAGFQRLNFACPRSVLAEAMRRLKQAL
ncbi:MAG: pyridoxal phosphate-dependent aminotransferase [Candidatus Syntrophosphaera sp.]|nr:pyridoxal phosphate-dependent aminotransferase [Candidatus Syntrophosphaera sp.]